MATGLRYAVTACGALAERLTAATPPDRDRLVDLLRAACVLIVVVGHWLMAAVVVTADGVVGANALATMPVLQPLTWILQVMPPFFVAGGFANLTVWRRTKARGGGYADYLHGRLDRLLRPTLVFVLSWQVLLALLRFLDLLGPEVDLVGHLLGQPLWFLGVYVAATALAPGLALLHKCRPVAVLAGLAGAAAAVDLTRFTGGFAAVGYVNLAVVWLFAQQVGFWYADRRLARAPRVVLAAVAVAALVALLALTAWGPYPVSMVGLPRERSNMTPPTLCLVVLTVGQVAVVLLARPALERWLSRPRPWAVVVALGSTGMTLYLWHMSVLVGAYALVVALGLPLPEAGSAAWWASRPLWLALLAGVLAAVTIPLSRVTMSAAAAGGAHGSRRAKTVVVAGAGAALATVGLLGFVASGLAPAVPWSSTLLLVPVDPVQNTLCVAAGLLLTRYAARGGPLRAAVSAVA